MRIAQLAASVEKVPPMGYGGTELVISNLTEELVRRGHSVTLFASADSQTSARLVPTSQRALRAAGEAARRWPAYDMAAVIALKQMIAEFDVVHNHIGWQVLPLLAELTVPVVTTNHNPIKDYCAPIYLEYAHLPYVAISEAFRKGNYPDQLNYIATVYNGIDVAPFTNAKNGKEGREYLLFIGRLCEDKGTDRAIEIAQRLKLPIILAGKVDISDQDYFAKKIRPHLNASTVRFIGEVNQQEKIELYAHAIATVYAIQFEEPFGLVMAESLAAGTPVLALDRGSVREVLSDGETAVIGQTVDELVDRFSQLKQIDASACQRRVSALFSQQQMVDAYEHVYHKLVGKVAAQANYGRVG